MTDREREVFKARMRTLEQVRAMVDQSGTVRLKTPVLCDRELRWHRLIPKTITN